MDITPHQRRRATIPLSNKSFDDIEGGCRGRGNRCSTEGGKMYEMLSEEEAPLLTCFRGVAGSHIGHHHPRRESIFYRPSVSDSDSSPISLSRKISANSEILPEDLLVTPFAQILHSLRNVRNCYVTLTDTYVPSVEKTNQNGMKREISDSDAAKMAVDTLEDLDWCLVQLEKVQTHRSVSDMATTKFKRILSRELNQFSETGSSASEVSEYINSTFLDRYKDLEPETTHNHVGTKQLRSSDEAHEDVDDGSIPASSAASGSDDNNSQSSSSLGASNNNIVSSNNRNSTSGQSFASCHRQLWAVSKHLKAPLIVPLESATAENLHLSLSTTATMTPSSSPSSSLSTSPSSLCHNPPLPPSSSSSSSPSSSMQMGVPSSAAQHRQHHQQQQHIRSKLEMALEKACDWSFDIFHLTDLTSNRPLLVLTNFIFEKHNLLKTLNVSQTVLLNFLNSIELNYSSRNSYHNNVHAADVVQSAYCLVNTASIRDSLTDLDLIATLVAAAVHDVDHPGVTNQYLINSELDLAILYNDQSVLENHHLAVAFTILKDKDVNIFQNLPGGIYRTIRRMVIQMVLATDMSLHLRLVADLKTMIETQKVIITNRGRSTSASTSSPQPVPCFLPSTPHQHQTSMSSSSLGDHKRLLLLDNADDKMQVLQTLVHCADLGNPAKHILLFQQWVERIMKEFFNQGDMEREQGLEVSPMCNRDISVEKAQVGFIDYIALPLWEAWDELVNHEFQGALDNLLYNRDWFENEMKTKISKSI